MRIRVSSTSNRTVISENNQGSVRTIIKTHNEPTTLSANVLAFHRYLASVNAPTGLLDVYSDDPAFVRMCQSDFVDGSVPELLQDILAKLEGRDHFLNPNLRLTFQAE